MGSHSKGALLGGVALPFEGSGYRIHSDWRPRDHRYATEEVAIWLTKVFRKVARDTPGTVAYLGDISARRGGATAKHRSHASGRDVDIFFLASDRAGRPLPEQAGMFHFGNDGRAERWSLGRRIRGGIPPVPDARFDAPRNWALVREMLSTSGVEVQWIFADQSLAALMLAEAEREGTPPEILAQAKALLHQPTDSQAHDDHMHVRLFCDPTDRSFGCSDRGPRRWLKKHWKYMAALIRR